MRRAVTGPMCGNCSNAVLSALLISTGLGLRHFLLERVLLARLSGLGVCCVSGARVVRYNHCPATVSDSKANSAKSARLRPWVNSLSANGYVYFAQFGKFA